MLIAVFVYAVFIALSDFSVIYETILHFPLESIPIIISLALLASFTRAVRYHLYLNNVNINIKFSQSVMIYFAGLSMELTPVRVGQVITSYILKEKFNKPVTQSAPVIVAERITDLIGLVVISVPAVFLVGEISWIILLAIAILLSIIILTQKRQPFDLLLNLFIRFKTLQNPIKYFKEMYENTYLLMRKRILAISSILSSVSWLIEGVGIFVIIKSLAIPIGLHESVLVYTKSAFIGGLSFIPNGIGVADSIFVSFLLPYGADFSIATTAMILARLHFMWFRIALGFFFLKLSFPKTNLNQFS